MNQTQAEQDSEAKEQNAFIARVFSVVVVNLLAFALWCGAAVLFTPLPVEEPGGMLFLRGMLMVIGGIVVGFAVGSTIGKLLNW